MKITIGQLKGLIKEAIEEMGMEQEGRSSLVQPATKVMPGKTLSGKDLKSIFDDAFEYNPKKDQIIPRDTDWNGAAEKVSTLIQRKKASHRRYDDIQADAWQLLLKLFPLAAEDAPNTLYSVASSCMDKVFDFDPYRRY